ncbi:MAG: hypothetical protein MZV70_44810 [Desulfobacterales bacterium]|nr:hypothetical protein [Desulfobacterales bacterium]
MSRAKILIVDDEVDCAGIPGGLAGARRPHGGRGRQRGGGSRKVPRRPVTTSCCWTSKWKA